MARALRRAATWGLALGALAAAAVELDPCETKPGWSTSRCPEKSAVACWSSAPGTLWQCWTSEWAPAWSVGSEAFTANAMCQATPATGTTARPQYDGACALPKPEVGPWSSETFQFLTWDEAYFDAERTLANMNNEQKGKLMNGIGWHPTDSGNFDIDMWVYVGNTAPIPELGIPSLNMQDAADGFRTYWDALVGTVTTWPSLLSLAATWDVNAVKAFAAALGEEFAAKGANTILGPSINVHRVARSGRNFEYLSGEDPYLGSRLVVPYIEGVHSKNILAVMKHFIMNEQETHRGKESSNVDQKTLWELYYPPFQAAVDAGVDAAMCSYNMVNGYYSCENGATLSDLKDKMGFRGFVQSDWWATHSTSVDQGLDQEMPGVDYANDVPEGQKLPYFLMSNLEEKGQGYIDAAAKRILATMYRGRVDKTTKCSPPNCEAFFNRTVTSKLHVALSRSLATESIVLLKNEVRESPGDDLLEGFTSPLVSATEDEERARILPLTYAKVKSIAIVGSVADAPVYDPAGVGQGGGVWNKGDYYSGGGSGHMVASGPVSALKGIEDRALQLGIAVYKSPTNDTAAALLMAGVADVTVVVAGATCGEASDRKSLSLDDNADELISAVAKTGKPVIVLLQIAGALVMPWKDEVAAIAAMFLGGQETGNAWASVLFGDHAPTGRLPITMPLTEADTIPPAEGADAVYSEGMATGYRNGKAAAFPFGHGLTYTTFEYGEPSNYTCGSDVCVKVAIRNAGKVTSRTVAQLYLKFPAVAGHPAPLLKGFEKTEVLRPGDVYQVTFRLTPRDVSYYDAGYQRWQQVGKVDVRIGESFTDIRRKIDGLELPPPPPQPAIPFDWTSVGIVVAAAAVVLALVAAVLVFRQRAGERSVRQDAASACTTDESDEE